MIGQGNWKGLGKSGKVREKSGNLEIQKIYFFCTRRKDVLS